MKIYTKKGDDGPTGLFYGGRVDKSATGPEAYGAVDEAVAMLGVARTYAEGDTAAHILGAQRELFVVGAELATGPENWHKLEAGVSKVTEPMVAGLENRIDEIAQRRGMPTEFVVPGGNSLAAALDAARTVIRRAERRAVAHFATADGDDSFVVPYLNRLADYVYMLARDAEESWLSSKEEE